MAGQLLIAAGNALRTAAPEVLSRISKRIGTIASPQAILDAMRNNKVTTALVGIELFGPASDFIKELIGDEPEIADLVSKITDLGYKPDAGDTLSAKEDGLLRFKDEFQLIDDCAAILGGHDNVIKLRNMLKIDDSVFTLRRQVRDLGYRR